ncbi:gliding motility protein [Streptomyces sporangiiformans]|uniref:gliding motility protein n=1 Tax=Streptomyces sporangiiformans TaxID=2315329 RepID=UPI0030B8D30E
MKAETEDAVKGAAETGTESAATSAEPAETASGDGVEIPKQQSAEAAADNQADEGAHK